MSTAAIVTEPDESDGVELQCHRCGYEWTYTGTLWKATCPSCGAKVDTGRADSGEE